MTGISTEDPTDFMTPAEQQLQELQQQLVTLHQNLRTMRHTVNNHLAVIMAMAELSQRNPAQYARFSQMCLEKAPQITSAIAKFSEMMDAAVKLHKESENPPPA